MPDEILPDEILRRLEELRQTLEAQQVLVAKAQQRADLANKHLVRARWYARIGIVFAIASIAHGVWHWTH